MRLQETLLRQRLGKVHVARRCQQKPKDLRPMALDNARELLRGIVFRLGNGHRVDCRAGCHHIGRRLREFEVYRRRTSPEDETFSDAADL